LDKVSKTGKDLDALQSAPGTQIALGLGPEGDAMKVVIAHNVEMVSQPIEMLREVAKVVIPGDGSEEELLAAVRDTNSLIVGINPPVPRRVIEAAPHLKHIGRMGVGVDSVDLKAATEHGVMVTNVPDVTSDTVAEFTVALLLSLARNIPRCDHAVRGGHWHERLDLIRVNTELFGKTHGLIGMGRIGSRVATRLKAFGMRIIYHKRTRDLDAEKSLGVEYVSLDALLREADSISLHTPLTEQTRNLLDRPQFRVMKPTVLLINQSRGKVIKDQALIEALRGGLIGGYATDVYDSEPPNPSGELFTFSNVVLTPHLAGVTRESILRTGLTIAQDAIRVLKGEMPKNLVNRDVINRIYT
jgi:D-3-phosphoglycerate dehydrogenase